jgi:hypothetical protein
MDLVSKGQEAGAMEMTDGLALPRFAKDLMTTRQTGEPSL